MLFTIVLNITCSIKILRYGVKYRGSDHRMFHNRYIFYVVVFNAIHIHSFHFLHLQNTKGLLLSYGSNSKWYYYFSNVLSHIQCVAAFSLVFNMLAIPVVHRHHFDCKKIHPTNWTHPIFQFSESFITAGLNASYGFLEDICAE